VLLSSAGPAGLEIVSARFGDPKSGRWLDAAPKLRELAAHGALDLDSVHPGVFGRDPAPNVVKVLELDYRLGGKDERASIAEGKPLKLGEAVTTRLELAAADDGAVTATAASAVRAELVFASGKRQTLEVTAPPAAAELKGPWRVELDSPVDNKRALTLPALVDLAKHADEAVKHFSGAATYHQTFNLAKPPAHLVLDLGRVHDLARVVVNGRDLGVLWQAPFTLDIGPALKPGENRLEIAVTNTWHNRLVGDEQHPADFEWGEDRGDKGHAMKAYPGWFLKNQARPEQGRKCFVVWYYHRKDTALLPAGLLGPVRLVPLASSR